MKAWHLTNFTAKGSSEYNTKATRKNWYQQLEGNQYWLHLSWKRHWAQNRTKRLGLELVMLTSIKPSTEADTRNWPSGEKRAHSGWLCFPNWTNCHTQSWQNKSTISLNTTKNLQLCFRHHQNNMTPRGKEEARAYTLIVWPSTVG